MDVAACRVSPSKLGRPLVGLRRSFASSLSGKTPQPVGCGVFRQKHPRLLFLFLIPLVIAGFDERAAEAYGKVRAALEAQGKPIGALDTLIAAHALSLEATLVTNNTREFSPVPDLGLANWAED